MQQVAEQAAGPRHPATGNKIAQGVDEDVFPAGLDQTQGRSPDRSSIACPQGQATGEQGDQPQSTGGGTGVDDLQGRFAPLLPLPSEGHIMVAGKGGADAEVECAAELLADAAISLMPLG